MKDIKKFIKNPDNYRYFLNIFLFFMIVYHSIGFCNAGSNYEQAVCFRPMCIDIAAIILINMDLKKWLNLTSLITAIAAFVFLHFGYMKGWIPDLCQYKYMDVIREGKIVGILWSLIYVSIIVDFIKNKSYKKLKTLNPVILIVWILYLVLIAIFGHKYSEQNFVIFEMLALFYVFMDEKKRRLIIKSLIDASIISFAYVMYKSLRHRPYDTERYQLYFSNSNMAGTYIAGIVVAIFAKITLIWKSKINIKLKVFMLVFMYLIMGIACSVTIFNYTRTTIAGLGLAFITALVVELIKSKNKLKIWLRYILVIGATLVCFNVTFLMLRYIPAYIDEPVLFIGEYDDESKIVQGESKDSSKYTTMGSFLRIVFGKWGILIDFEGMEKGTEVQETVVDNRDVTNGRTEVWERFIPEFNFTGHYPRYVYDEEGNIIPHAHNSYFQIIYEDGLITGIVYIIFTLLLYILGIINLFKTKKEYLEDLYALLMTGLIMVSQCLEWISRPQYVLYAMGIFSIMIITTKKKQK